MKQYKLLTPGPLTTTDTVKEEMMFDHCTWDDDYKQITQKIRKELLELADVNEQDYTVVLMQGCRADFADIQNKKECGGNRQWQRQFLRKWAANTKGKAIT